MVALMNAINQVIKRGKSKFAHNDFIYSILKILKETTKMIWFCFLYKLIMRNSIIYIITLSGVCCFGGTFNLGFFCLTFNCSFFLFCFVFLCFCTVFYVHVIWSPDKKTLLNFVYVNQKVNVADAINSWNLTVKRQIWNFEIFRYIHLDPKLLIQNNSKFSK